MRSSRKISMNELPSVILTFVFVALLGGVGLIIAGDLKADDTVTAEACGTGYVWNETATNCYLATNSSVTRSANTTGTAYGFIGGSQTGFGNIGNKMGLIGTILILAIIIGLVVSYFAVRNM